MRPDPPQVGITAALVNTGKFIPQAPLHGKNYSSSLLSLISAWGLPGAFSTLRMVMLGIANPTLVKPILLLLGVSAKIGLVIT